MHETKNFPLIGMVQTAGKEGGYGDAILTRWAAGAVASFPSGNSKGSAASALNLAITDRV